MAFNDPNLSAQLEQINLRLQAVENQLAIVSRQMGVPFHQMPAVTEPGTPPARTCTGIPDRAHPGTHRHPTGPPSHTPAPQPAPGLHRHI
jgi:hypothetical protein